MPYLYLQPNNPAVLELLKNKISQLRPALKGAVGNSWTRSVSSVEVHLLPLPEDADPEAAPLLVKIEGTKSQRRRANLHEMRECVASVLRDFVPNLGRVQVWPYFIGNYDDDDWESYEI